MAQVDHNAQTVHLAYDLFTETAHTAVGVTASGRVTKIVVTIMAERHIDNAALGKMLQVLQLAVEGQTVLNTKHDGLAAVALVLVEVARRAGNAQVGLVLADNLLDLVEDKVGIFGWSGNIEVDE